MTCTQVFCHVFCHMSKLQGCLNKSYKPTLMILCVFVTCLGRCSIVTSNLYQNVRSNTQSTVQPLCLRNHLIQSKHHASPRFKTYSPLYSDVLIIMIHRMQCLIILPQSIFESHDKCLHFVRLVSSRIPIVENLLK